MMKVIFAGLGLLAGLASSSMAQDTPFFFQARPLSGARTGGIYVDNSALTVQAANVPNLPDQSAYLTFSMIYSSPADQALPTIVSLSNDAPNLAADPLWIGWQASSSPGRPNLIVQVSDGTNINQFRAMNVGVNNNSIHVITASIRAHGALTELTVVQDDQNLSNRVFNYRNNASAGTTPLPPINIPLKKITLGNQIYPNHFTFFNRTNAAGNAIGAPYQFAYVGHAGNVFLHFAATTETQDPLVMAGFFQNPNNMKAQQFSFYRDPNDGILISYPYAALFGEYNLVSSSAGPFVAPINLSGPAEPGGFSYNSGLVSNPVAGGVQQTILAPAPDPQFNPPISSWLIAPADFDEP